MVREQFRQLRRAGFNDPERAARLLEGQPEWLLGELSRVADPDLALLIYLRLREAAAAELQDLESDSAARRRLMALLGTSSALGELLIAHPAWLRVLRQHVPFESGTVEVTAGDVASPGADAEALRTWYWQRIIQLAAWDLSSSSDTGVVAQVMLALSDAADIALNFALEIARRELDVDVPMAVISMGKAGARELNYVSDVDVMYVCRDTAQAPAAGKLASRMAQILSTPGTLPPPFELDTALRPEGQAGPLVRSLESFISYYENWAENWEFQALLKARVSAGDETLGHELLDALWPAVWSAAGREGFVEQTRDMRRRVESLIPAKRASREIKLGQGGLRDIEFTVQLLQLVHGRTDPALRVKSTLQAIDTLSEGGYIGRQPALELSRYYKYLRVLEHRIQLHRMHRTHTLPTNEADLRRIARAMGLTPPNANGLEQFWQQVRHAVRNIHLDLYYRPLLPAIAHLSTGQAALEPEAAKARLAAIGFLDPQGALANIAALSAGISRTAAIQRQILPVLIGWLSEGPAPDFGLAAFRTISERAGSSPWYMRLLRDSRVAAERLAILLSTSRFVAAELPNLVEAVSWLDDDAQLAPLAKSALEVELDAVLSRRVSAQEFAEAGRYLRRRELLRTAMAEGLGLISPAEKRSALTTAGEIAIEAALRGARLAHPNIPFAVFALGRLGGAEQGYASDADLMFVYDEPQAAPGDSATAGAAENPASAAQAIARALIAGLTSAGTEPPFTVDLDLRPEGQAGPLVRSLASYRSYYADWVEPWERQALLRARFVAGDPALGRQFAKLIDGVRYQSDPASLRQVRTMKARVEKERLPNGVVPQRHLKLGPGGLSDVEWAAQMLQLRFAAEHPELRTVSTTEAIKAAERSGLISGDDADRLLKAWELAGALRDANVGQTGRTRGKALDVLPHTSRDLAVAAALIGRPGQARVVEEEYLSAARRARRVAARIIFEE